MKLNFRNVKERNETLGPNSSLLILTLIIRSHRIHSFKYQRSICNSLIGAGKDVRVGKLELSLFRVFYCQVARGSTATFDAILLNIQAIRSLSCFRQKSKNISIF